LYNFDHIDKKKGTVAYKERHGEKFQGKLVPFGAKVRYLPASERELSKREKLDASLRDAIFVGYRMHSGGRWTGQYLVLDAEAYTEIPVGTMQCAYEHAISEIYLPGSSGDDTETFPTFPVANGDLKEASKASSADCPVDSIDNPTTLTTEVDEAKISSERPAAFLSNDDAYPGGDINGTERGEIHELSSAPASVNRDCWSIQGDYLVRTHNCPRTALFSPLEVPEDPPPIELKHIEVLRVTKPRFSGQQWPKMELVEDCWVARPSDAKPLLNPLDGSTLTWTGETVFERVLPIAPKGKVWCGTELARARAVPQRAQDVHPLHW
jgi:hypothetical protein